MSEFKGTPGPWKFGPLTEFGYTRFYVSQADGAPYTPHYSDVVSLNAETVADERRSIQEANARLIAAAPELLEALQRTLSWLSSYQAEAAMGPTGPYEQARAAIAKATGAA